MLCRPPELSLYILWTTQHCFIYILGTEIVMDCMRHCAISDLTAAMLTGKELLCLPFSLLPGGHGDIQTGVQLSHSHHSLADGL